MAYTLNGERVQLVIDDNSGGAITEIAIDGVNLVNSANKFRQVQFGLTWSDKTGSFFLVSQAILLPDQRRQLQLNLYRL